MPGDPTDLKTLKAQAFTAMNQGRFDVAEPLYLEALRLSEEQVGKEHPDTATLLQTLGDAYLHVNRFAEAIPHYQQLLVVGESLLGDSHPNVANVLYKLSKCYDEIGDRHSAISHAGRALDVARRCFPSDHPNLDLLRELYQALMKPTSQPFKTQHPPSTMPAEGPGGGPRASQSQMPSQRPGSSRSQIPAQGQGPGSSRSQIPAQGQGPGSSLSQMPAQDQNQMAGQPQLSSNTEQQRAKRPAGLGAMPSQSQASFPERSEKARRPQMSSGPGPDGFAAPPSLAPRSKPTSQSPAQHTDPNSEDLEAQYQSGSFIHPFAQSQLTGSHDVQQDLPLPQRDPAPKPVDPSQFNTGSYTHPLLHTEQQRQVETGPLQLNETTSQDFFRNPGSLNFSSVEDDGWHSVGEGGAEDVEEDEESSGVQTDRDWKNQMMSGWPGHAGKDLADTNNSWIVSDEIRMPARSERSKSREFESEQYETGSHSMQAGTKPVVGRRTEGSSERVINTVKILKTVLPPLFGFLLLAGIGVYLIKTSSAPKPIEPPVVKQTATPAKAATSKTYQSADGQITLKVLTPTTCELTLGTDRKQIACSTIDGSWNDLPMLIFNTLLHREYYFQVIPQGLQTQEGSPVYSMASLDFSVIMRMREIAAYVEEYKQVAGPGYPTQTSAPGFSQKLVYINPFSGRAETAPFVAIPISDGSDGQHVVEDLERSNRRGPESQVAGAINCYAILVPENKSFVGRRFLLTGTGSNALMIAGTKFGASCYVLEASSINYRDKTFTPKALPPQSGAKKGIPDNAMVRIVTQPAMPLFIMHHFLPLVTGILAVLLFWRSQAAPGAATWAPSAADLRWCRTVSVVLLIICIITASIQALL